MERDGLMYNAIGTNIYMHTYLQIKRSHLHGVIDATEMQYTILHDPVKMREAPAASSCVTEPGQ